MFRLSRERLSRMAAVCAAGGSLLLIVSTLGCGSDPAAGGGAGATGGSATGGGAGGNNPEPTGTGGVSGGGGAAGNATVIATMSGGLNKPTDVKFNPYKMGELWVTNQGDNSMTIVATATTAPTAERRRDSAHSHFMSLPSAIAFGAEPTTIMDAAGAMVKGTFATCGDSRNAGDDFMGPVLWVSDLRIFAVNKALREAPFNSERAGGLGSHIDMLHMSPLCTGIAWQGEGNIYWTYSGISKSFVKYDFRGDHWIGNDDHRDGAIWRYNFTTELGYLPGVPSHLSYRPSEQALYFADTANGRVVKFLPASAPMMTTMPNRDGLTMGPSQQFAGGVLTDVVAKGTVEKPSGLYIKDESMFVTDNATGKIHKFSIAGAAQGSVQTDVRAGGLAGVTVGPDNKVYFVDMLGNRVLRLESGL